MVYFLREFLKFLFYLFYQAYQSQLVYQIFLDEEALKVGTRAMLQVVLDHQHGTGG